MLNQKYKNAHKELHTTFVLCDRQRIYTNLPEIKSKGNSNRETLYEHVK